MTEQSTEAGNEPPAAVHGIREQAQPASPLLLILTGVFAIVVAALLTYYARTADLTEWQGWAKDALTVLQGRSSQAECSRCSRRSGRCGPVAAAGAKPRAPAARAPSAG